MSQFLTPIEIKNLYLRNRVAMVPMCLFCAGEDGIITDWHLVHYGARAIGQVGLIIQEATAVEKRGRLSPRDLGMWTDEQVEGQKKLVELIHSLGGKIAIQLGHGGRKSRPGPEEIIAPSAVPFSRDFPTPREMTSQDLERVLRAFQEAARRACLADYDAIEIHGAHGYLLHQFLSPHSNHRQDNYGGVLENRMRFPLEVIQAVKEAMPAEKLLMIRLSAVEYVEGGYSLPEIIETSRALIRAGVDILDISTGGGGTTSPRTYPGYQVPYAQKIREQLNIPVIACGLLTRPEMAEEWVASGRTDLVGLGRVLLRDPHWVLKAAVEMGVSGIIPEIYQRAFPDEK